MEFKHYGDFREYVRALPTDKNPTNCPLIRVLPEEINYKGYVFNKGTLMCFNKEAGNQFNTDSLHMFGVPRCELKFPNLNEQGELEILCVRGNKIKLK